MENDEFIDKFMLAIQCMLTNWPALNMCLENIPPNSNLEEEDQMNEKRQDDIPILKGTKTEKIQQLAIFLVYSIHNFDIKDIELEEDLNILFDINFNTDLEDGSSKEFANLMIKCYK